MSIKSVAEAICEATAQLLQADPNVFVIGEGTTDHKHCFGTVPDIAGRIHDMPVAENAMTGVCIGAALAGMRPILVHMRADFMLYSADQLINNAAKWYAMFGGQRSIPLVVRAIMGRGWGQGYQHCGHYEALFAAVPGLRVVCPSNAYDAKGMLIWAVRSPNPVLFFEHRWTHDLRCEVPDEMYEVEPTPVVLHTESTACPQIRTYGYLVHEAMRAVRAGVRLHIEDMRGPVGANWTEESNCPPSPALSKDFYPTAATLGAAPLAGPHDVPNAAFKGPF